ncbi:MAG: 16S rRNA (guanine(527)-N(7))-methyltransferase RsmG [Oscillospiraceae bacterium]|nr:16S rRNA (guanine(527)-N(7))-methyltransferase RsmG [Oscillospiraceae bacterium]
MIRQLTEGLAQLGLPADAAPRLDLFATAVLEKNRVMNLTAITEKRDFAALHLLDSAALLGAAPFRGKRVIDVGTGAGFPGIPLRIIEPDFDLTLLDSLGKRIDFLREVIARMDLHRVEAVHDRAESFAAGHRQQYDLAVSRAVAPLNLLCELALPLVAVGGQFLAMKSVNCDDEIAAARNAVGQLGGQLRACWDYTVPTTAIEHRVVVIDKVRATPENYPRSWARICKHPL